MKALTLIRPMDLALVDPRIGKDVENRAWRNAKGLQAQARALAGQRFAIHAGQKYDHAYRRMIREFTGIELWPDDTTPGHIVGVVTASDLQDWHESRWFIDDGEQLALVVRSPVRLQDPVPCTGGRPGLLDAARGRRGARGAAAALAGGGGLTLPPSTFLPQHEWEHRGDHAVCLRCQDRAPSPRFVACPAPPSVVLIQVGPPRREVRP